MKKRIKRHTPGPWELEKENSHIRTIATIHWCGKRETDNYWYDVLGNSIPLTPMEREANAHLIKSAPDLLEALEALDGADRLYNIDHESSIAKMVKSAIAKAYGED